MKITRELVNRLQMNNRSWKDLSEEDREAFKAVYNGGSTSRSNIKRYHAFDSYWQRVTPRWHWEGVYCLVDTHQPRIEAMISGKETTKVKEKVMVMKTRTEVTGLTVYDKETGKHNRFEATIVAKVVHVRDSLLEQSITISVEDWSGLEYAINQLMSVIIARGEG